MKDSFDVPKRIKELCKQKNISFYRLSKISGIPQSTLTNILNRGTVPSIYTLEKICHALDISLSLFFAEDKVYDLSCDQEKLIEFYVRLPEEDKRRVLAYIQGLSHI